MKIAVLSLTRDRLEYSQHCFESLRQNAGCQYDHFVLDQGSRDGTQRWLLNGVYTGLALLNENVGISIGLNKLLARAGDTYDVYVKYDNDCELVTPNALKDICQLVMESEWILGPVMHGYGTPLVTLGETKFGEHTFSEKHQIQGCFLAGPASLYRDFRYSERNPTWGGDDPEVCAYWRKKGNHVGQVLGYEANHYETTEGQEERYPEYFAQKVSEGMPWT